MQLSDLSFDLLFEFLEFLTDIIEANGVSISYGVDFMIMNMSGFSEWCALLSIRVDSLYVRGRILLLMRISFESKIIIVCMKM